MTARRMRPVTVYFEPEQLEALTKLSRLTRVPKAVYVREALDRLLRGDGAVTRYGAMTMEVLGRKLGPPKFIGQANGRKRRGGGFDCGGNVDLHPALYGDVGQNCPSCRKGRKR